MRTCWIWLYLKPSKNSVRCRNLSRPLSSFNIIFRHLVTAVYGPIRRDLSSGFSTFWFVEKLDPRIDNTGSMLKNTTVMVSHELCADAAKWTVRRKLSPSGKRKSDKLGGNAKRRRRKFNFNNLNNSHQCVCQPHCTCRPYIHFVDDSVQTDLHTDRHEVQVADNTQMRIYYT